MNNKHSQSKTLKRESGNKMPEQIIVYVEGRNTERTYIDLLKVHNLKLIPIVKQGNGIGSCTEFVNNSQKHFDTLPKAQRAKFRQKWLMFDYDGHNDLKTAVLEARKKGFNVAFSSMCIEYWFLLHFENHSGDPIPCEYNSHSKAQISMINRYISNYNRLLPPKAPKVGLYDAGSKCVKEDFFELLMAVNPVTKCRRVEDACNRSIAIHQAKIVKGIEFQESVTTVYQFLETIGFVKKEKEHYRLNG